MKLATVTIFTTFALAATGARAADRTWTNTDGKTITGEMQSADQSTVTLSVAGKTYKIPLSSLSPADRKHVTDTLAARAAAAASSWDVQVNSVKKTSKVHYGALAREARASDAGKSMVFVEVFLTLTPPKNGRGSTSTTSFRLVTEANRQPSRHQPLAFWKGHSKNSLYNHLHILDANEGRHIIPGTGWSITPLSRNPIEVSLLFAIPKSANIKAVQHREDPPVPTGP